MMAGQLSLLLCGGTATIAWASREGGGGLRYVLCAVCFVLCALCCVLCALCFRFACFAFFCACFFFAQPCL